LFKGLRN